MSAGNSRKPGWFIKSTLSTLLITALSFSISGCYFLPKEEEVLAPPIKQPEKVDYETIKVEKSTIVNDIKCSGNFVSVSKTDLYYKDRGGRLEKVFVKEGDTVKKGQLLAQLETGGIETDLKLQQIALRKSQIDYEKLKAQSGVSSYDLELAKLDVDSNEIRLDSLKKELESTKLISTVSGTVVYVTETKQGDNLYAYTTIVRIADPKNLQLLYTGDSVTSFKLGDKVEVTVNDKKYTGEVVSTPADAPSDADETAKKSIKIKVEGLQGLGDTVDLGDNAEIRLVLEKHDNVIVLKRSLINLFNGRKFVNVLKDGVREERDVVTGIQNGTEIEITKGLEVGELVISK